MSQPELSVVTNEAPETRPAGLLLPCPRCGQAEATVRLELADLDTCHCVDCDETFALDDVRDFIARWQRVLGWVATFPS